MLTGNERHPAGAPGVRCARRAACGKGVRLHRRCLSPSCMPTLVPSLDFCCAPTGLGLCWARCVLGIQHGPAGGAP